MYPSDRDVISECPSDRDVISECPSDGRTTKNEQSTHTPTDFTK